MIRYIKGDLLQSPAHALVNTVNTVGVMGKGVALQFKNHFPDNYRQYVKACKEGLVHAGKLFVTEEESLLQGKKTIINFPTKTDWRKPSEYSYIDEGLTCLSELIKEYKIQSIALPPLGAGNGGLVWSRVKDMIERKLGDVDCDITVYEPNSTIQEAICKERVKLTPARAMLLSVMYDMVRNEEFISEFAAEKIAYFLHRFGAEEAFRLTFQPNFYGPYSGKVKHVLYYLNGSYILGYSAKDKKPFEELDIVPEAEADVVAFLSRGENKTYFDIAERTKQFLSGFYATFGLELLSTVDFIMNEKKVTATEEVRDYLAQWSNRKKSLFSDQRFVEVAVKHLTEFMNIPLLKKADRT